MATSGALACASSVATPWLCTWAAAPSLAFPRRHARARKGATREIKRRASDGSDSYTEMHEPQLSARGESSGYLAASKLIGPLQPPSV